MVWTKTGNIKGPTGASGATGNPVTLDTAQTVTGAKDFTGGLKANGSTVVVTTDTRLSDTRVPTDGTVTTAKIASGGITPASITGIAVITTDTRLSNARTPTAHASTHAYQAVDAITVDVRQLTATGTPSATTYLRGDGTWTTPPAAPVTSVAGRTGAVVLGPTDITGTAVITTDPRLSDTRTPTDGTVTTAKIATGGLAATTINGTAVITTDPRLSDARTPTAHAATHTFGGTDPVSVDYRQLTATGTRDTTTYLRGDGTWAAAPTAPVTSVAGRTGAVVLAPADITGTAVITTDSRLSDARTPTAHAATHASGGTDAVTLAESQVINLVTDLAAKYSAANPVPVPTGLAATGTANASTYLRGDGTWAVTPISSGGSGAGAGEVASYTGPAANLTVGNTADSTSMTVTWNSIAGHKYKITGYATVDTSANAGAIDVHFDVPGQSASKYVVFSNTPALSTPYYGSAVGEFTETSTQTRTVALSAIRFGSGATLVVRANSVMLNVEDITPGSSLVVAPSSNAPTQNVVVASVTGTTSVTLAASPQVLPGCTYTIPVSGTYQVTFFSDFIWISGDAVLVAQMYLDGTATNPGRQALYYPVAGANNSARQTTGQTTTVTATAGQVLTLQGSKTSGPVGSGSTAGGVHTGFTVVLPGTGNLDSDVLDFMGAF